MENDLRFAVATVLIEKKLRRSFTEDEREKIRDVWGDPNYSYWCLKCDDHFNWCRCRVNQVPGVHVPLK